MSKNSQSSLYNFCKMKHAHASCSSSQFDDIDIDIDMYTLLKSKSSSSSRSSSLTGGGVELQKAIGIASAMQDNGKWCLHSNPHVKHVCFLSYVQLQTIDSIEVMQICSICSLTFVGQACQSPIYNMIIVSTSGDIVHAIWFPM